jgi:hypothetical protein
MEEGKGGGKAGGWLRASTRLICKSGSLHLDGNYCRPDMQERPTYRVLRPRR